MPHCCIEKYEPSKIQLHRLDEEWEYIKDKDKNFGKLLETFDLPSDVIRTPLPAGLCESCPVGKAEDSFLVAGGDLYEFEMFEMFLFVISQ